MKQEPRRRWPGRGWKDAPTPDYTGRVRYLHAYVRRPVTWVDLRHERERHVYREAFWRGFDFGLRFAEQRRDDLAAADDHTRRLYAALGGWQP